MKVKDLREAIEGLWRTQRSWQTTEAAADVGAFVRLLAGQDDLTIQEFCERVDRALSKKGGAGKAAKATKPLNEISVARYLDELNSARDDNAAFEAIINRAGKDRAIKTEEAYEIARRFTGSNPSGKSKAAAWKAILDRQIADKRSTQRIRQVPGLF